MRNSFLLTTGALLAGLLLDGCSHSSDTATTDSAIGTVTTPAAPAEHSSGIKVDSLNGIPGHHFGEPLSAFPGLVPGESNIKGMKRYYYSSDKPAPNSGWFGKHSAQLLINYYFVDNKFAYFIASAYGDNRQLLSDEVSFLFGIGEQFQLNDVIWQGKQCRAIYTHPFTTHGPAAQLEVVSVPLEALQKQRENARLKAENAN